MTKSILTRLRRFWLDVHLWIGVGLFVALVPLGVSGALLVWHEPLDQLLHPGRFAVSDGPATPAVSVYLDAARQGFGDRADPAQIRLPREAGQPVTVSGRVRGGEPVPGRRPETLTAWLDPVTGKVLDIANPQAETLGVMHRLHGSLLIPGRGLGRKVVGWLGWAMTASCLTGLWLWWPRNGAVLRAMRWRRSPSTFDNLHHMVGFWILVPLLVVSLTGVYISFPQTSRALFGVAAPAEGRAAGRRPGSSPPLTQPALPVDMAAAVALDGRPGATLASVSLPTTGGEPAWRIEVNDPAQARPVTVRVSDRDATVREAGDRAGPGQPDPLSRLMRRLHDGQDMPFVWQLLVFLTGVTPVLLGVTGIVMWLRRRARRVALRG
ncbi:MAG: PepSY-associated TM helix domain-containing protein [Caulobacter sp.]|nr:PepSY-associated TM helix domain-containing protein [Caulobacter sp.]